MLLEKIKKHSGKISFLVINLLLIGIGALYFKQKSLEAGSGTFVIDNSSNSIANLPNGVSADQSKADEKKFNKNVEASVAAQKTSTEQVAPAQKSVAQKMAPVTGQSVTSTAAASSSMQVAQPLPTPKATTSRS